MDKKSVLIVDDMASNIQTLAQALKEEYDLKVATSGKRALELVSLEEIDLILLDIEMPEMDGFATLEKLKQEERSKHTPVIFVTAHINAEDEERGLLAGAVDYITKPISPCIVKARVRTHITLKEQRDQLSYEATHDRLTKLFNRHQLDKEGARKFSRALRQNDEKFSVMMIDIDNFKSINDTYGHLMGDSILESVAELIDKNRRVEDFVVRYGGEEFVILLENCTLDNAASLAQKLRKEIEELHPSDLKITCSFGVSNLKKEHKNLEELLKEADTALYKAKEGGRNRVVVFERD